MGECQIAGGGLHPSGLRVNVRRYAERCRASSSAPVAHRPPHRGASLIYVNQSEAGKQGIKKQPKNPLVIQANLQILWELMENREEIDLGGITSICTPPPHRHGQPVMVWCSGEPGEPNVGDGAYMEVAAQHKFCPNLPCLALHSEMAARRPE